MARAERILVGVINGAFGVVGEVRLTSFCSSPDAIENYCPLHSDDGNRTFHIELTGKAGKHKHLIAKLPDIDTRKKANQLRGTKLFANRDAFPALPEDEFYHSDLVGLEARNTDFTKMGRIVSVQNHGANDILEISRSGFKDPELLAFKRDTVPKVDIENGYIVVDLPK